MHVVLQRKMKGFVLERCDFGISTYFNNQNQTKLFQFDVLAESLLVLAFAVCSCDVKRSELRF